MTKEQLAIRAVSTAITNLRLEKHANLDRKTINMLVSLDNHLFECMMTQHMREMDIVVEGLANGGHIDNS